MTVYPVIRKRRSKAGRFQFFRFKSVPITQEEDIKLPKKVVKLVKEGREFYDFVENSQEVHSVVTDSVEILERLRRHASSDFMEKIDVLQNEYENSIRLVINGREKDPGLIHQSWMFLHYSEEIKSAINYLQMSLNPAETVIYTHNDKITAKYSYEHQRHCNHKANDLWVDAQMLLDIYYEVTEDRNIESKFLTVGDIGSGRAAVARVRYGSDLTAILQNVFGIIDDEVMFTGKGIMSGRRVAGGDRVTRDIEFITYSKSPDYNEEGICIKCGQCRKVCPAGFVPGDVLTAIETNNTAYLEKIDFSKCTGCGMCSYVCGGDRMLSQKILQYKKTLN